MPIFVCELPGGLEEEPIMSAFPPTPNWLLASTQPDGHEPEVKKRTSFPLGAAAWRAATELSRFVVDAPISTLLTESVCTVVLSCRSRVGALLHDESCTTLKGQGIDWITVLLWPSTFDMSFNSVDVVVG